MRNIADITNYENTIMESSDFQFNCFSIGESETVPHWHDHLEIVLIDSGTCSVYINGELFTCEKGDFVLVPPDNLHSILPQEKSSYHAIVVGNMLLKGIMSDHHCHSSLFLFFKGDAFAPFRVSCENAQYSSYLQVLENIIREDRIKSEGYQAIIKAEIVKLLSLLGRGHPEVFTARSGKRDEKTQTMIRVINYLTNHYTEKISISDMSRYANMSLQHFCRTFKAYTGKTLVEFLTHLKLEKAYRLIITTDVPISQIPELAGFCNINYFSRVFRKKYGTTPSSTRSSQRRSGL